jgi:tetratricopeptide (TPR) repeat protein
VRRRPGHIRSLCGVLLAALVLAGAAPCALAQTVAEAPGDPVAEGRASLAAGDYERATVLFTKAAGSGSAEAQELLGLAYERAGKLAQAKAAYQAYLKAHPSGPDADRVRQRLSGVQAAIESEAEAEFAARKKTKLAAEGKSDAQLAAIRPPVSVQSGKADREDAGWTWEKSGSVGQSYYRDDGFTGSGLLRGSLAGHETSTDQLVSYGDIRLKGTDGETTLTARVSANDRQAITSSSDDSTTVSAAYVEMRDKLNGLSARIGRQSRYGGGVFGRFDGALLGIQASDQILLQAVAGSPVYYGEDEPFADGRYFVGASIDVATADKLWTGTLYALEQDVGSLVDRRAVGGELRFAAEKFQSYGGVDYDIFYGELNSAYVSANWQPAKDWSFYASLDYRRVPFLLTSNALLGQPVDSLSDLFDLFGAHDTEALAVDRTATAATATLGLAYSLNTNWQASLDVTVADYSGTPASGGVDKVPDPGTEYYLSARLDGSDVVKEGDYAGLALSLIDSDLYRSYIGDVSLRYPLNEEWRLSPRLRTVYRDVKGGSDHSLLLVPSLGVSYRVSEHWSLESEAAVLWEEDWTATGRDSETELRLMIGYRYIL